MSNSKINIVGIGCDLKSENEETSRKYAIENLSGGEKDRINWMTKNMPMNKAYVYSSINKNKIESLLGKPVETDKILKKLDKFFK